MRNNIFDLLVNTKLITSINYLIMFMNRRSAQAKLEEANINETIARNIKIIRRLKGLTLKDMGSILNVTG